MSRAAAPLSSKHLDDVKIRSARRMALFRFCVWSVLPVVVLCSGPDLCGFQESSSSHSTSSLLESLKCYNDYRSQVLCMWKKQGNSTLQLWIRLDDSSELCVPFNAAADNETERCRYETPVLTIGIIHTAFFLNNETKKLCSSAQHKFDRLALSLRARPPLNLSSSEEKDGGRRLQWSSPYPLSSLNQNLTYQLSYRTQTEDRWTSENVTYSSVKLEKKMLLPGRRYEARVRTRASLGQWSEWSPVVTWRTKDDFVHAPPLDCVLDGEKSVTCSWEVSAELAHLVTYQLTCRPKHSAQPERCCRDPAVSSDSSGTAVRFSCLLTAADPEHLQLSLQPAHNAKIFKVHQHIQPGPPLNVTVREKDGNWLVEWTEPVEKLRLFYQVWYYRTLDQRSSVPLNTSEKSTSFSILATSLASLQDYQVKVRSLVVPGQGSIYKGIPSEWTDPVDWTSNEATWSISKLIYIFTGVLAAAVLLVLYNIVPACQRKVTLWENSVPSPGKSKLLFGIQSAPSPTLMESEKTSFCKVQHLDSVSTCSSEALLWSNKDTETKCDSGCWKRDTLPSQGEKVSGCDTSSMSFSGPYIFCQEPVPVFVSETVQNEETEKEMQSDVQQSSFPLSSPLYGKDYVCLPNHTLSRSTEDLTCHSDNNSRQQGRDGAEQNPYFVATSPWPTVSDNRSSLIEPVVCPQPSDYTSEPFPSWPQVGAVQASGYCHLPPGFMAADK